MTDQDTHYQAAHEELAKELSDKLNIDINVAREITPDDILYLLDHAPFLQIANGTPTGEQDTVEIIEAVSGWDILNYGDALSSSPGRFLVGGGDFRMGDDIEGHIINPGKGTLVKQAFDTATQMVQMAKALGWSSIRIIDGHPIMARAAWIESYPERSNLYLQDYTPDNDDLRVLDLLHRSDNEVNQLRRQISATPSA